MINFNKNSRKCYEHAITINKSSIILVNNKLSAAVFFCKRIKKLKSKCLIDAREKERQGGSMRS